MSRIAVMMSINRPDAPLSSHFGKAKWIMVADPASVTFEFIRNEGLNGRSAAELVIREGCTDVILTDIGDGALGHLQMAHIRAWAAPGPVTGRDAARMFAEEQLTPVPAVRSARRQGAGHGCCRSSHARSQAAGHCQG